MKKSMIALALYLAAIALFIFLIVGTQAKIIQLTSWTGETFLLVALGLSVSGGVVLLANQKDERRRATMENQIDTTTKIN
jgi:predicted Kef-type K+ transport protein